MIAFDTDVLTDIFFGKYEYVAKLAAIPKDDLAVPIVALEEVIRGWFHAIRSASSGKTKLSLIDAYREFQKALEGVREYRVLPYSSAAHAIYLQLKSQKIRVGTQDLRIASIALAHEATLITRNRRDYEVVPSLKLEVWN